MVGLQVKPKKQRVLWVAGAGLSEAKEAPGFRAAPSNPGHSTVNLLTKLREKIG